MQQHSRELSVEGAELALESPFGELADAVEELVLALRDRFRINAARNATILGAIALLALKAIRRN